MKSVSKESSDMAKAYFSRYRPIGRTAGNYTAGYTDAGANGGNHDKGDYSGMRAGTQPPKATGKGKFASLQGA